ncbi:MAG TPA: CPBP family intramembrane glutamic endopeptidase [Saprospiraceae bacterium]|nr:CPBP family intramembrane glutamic endopeptidase [Saprospiraceae bacterium]
MKNELLLSLIRVLPFLIIIIIIKLRSKEGKLDQIDLYLKQPDKISSLLIWCLAYLIFILITEYVLYQFGLLEIKHWNHSLISSIILIIGAVILAPIAEELIFRGIILEKLIQWKIRKQTAIFLQAILFVLLHNFTYDLTITSTISIATTLVDAVLFAYAKYETKSIYTSMSMHSTGNLIATLERFIF